VAAGHEANETMSHPTRRAALAGALSTLAATPARAGVKTIPAGKLLPYLEAYLKLPVRERSLFNLAYYAMAGGQPARNVRLTLLHGGRRAPMAIGDDGRISGLPSLQQLQSGAQVEGDAPDGLKLSVALGIEPALRPAATLPAPELAAAITQAAAGAKKAAGVARMFVPKLEAVAFRGATFGEVVRQDGSRARLPMAERGPSFAPAQWPGAREIRLDRTPSAIFIGPAPKKT
jgi:hypothetical protein